MNDLVRTRLRRLHDEYVAAANRAVAEGREDLLTQLVADYPDAALRVMTATDTAPAR
jgi:hypothetical protein